MFKRIFPKSNREEKYKILWNGKKYNVPLMRVSRMPKGEGKSKSEAKSSDATMCLESNRAHVLSFCFLTCLLKIIHGSCFKVCLQSLQYFFLSKIKPISPSLEGSLDLVTCF